MSGTGYYEEQLARGMIPTEHVGQTWEQRTNDGVIQSPFPPATVGVPAEDFEPFHDFRRHRSAVVRAEHPEWDCPGGCGRWATPPICQSTTCGSARCEPIGRTTDDGTEQDHRCLSCGQRFLALLPCGPCRADRGLVDARPKTTPPVRRPSRTAAPVTYRRRSA